MINSHSSLEMSSNSSTRSTRKLPSGFFYNETVLLKNKGLVYKIIKLLFTLQAVLKLEDKKASGNKSVATSNYFFKNYGRLFKNNGKRVPDPPKYPHEKREEMIKLLLNPSKMGSFLHGIAQFIKPKNIKDKSDIEKANEIIDEIKKTQEKLLNPEPFNASRTFHTVNGNHTGTGTVHSMFNDMSLNNEVRQGGLHNMKRSFRNSTRKAKRRSMSRR